MVQVYWPMVTVLQRMIAAGRLQGTDPDDIEAILADAEIVDEYEQDVDGNLAMSFRSQDTGVFVDTRKEQVINCPNCGTLIGLMTKQRTG